jgi:4-hydroxybenzoate polyprenyltransferase
MRAGNLLLLSTALMLMRHTLILPILEIYETPSSLSDSKFNWLTLAVVLAAASGYLINNLMDVGVDDANGKKRGLQIIGESRARFLYYLFTVGAVVSAFVVGDGSIKSRPFLATAVSCGLLYFYSVDYKKLPLLGNVVIAALTAFAIGMPLFCDEAAADIEPLKIFVIGYASFAFLLSLIRELIKSCEDLEGDAAYGIRTMAVAAGTRTTSIIAAALSMLTCGIIGSIQYMTSQWDNLYSFLFVTLLVQLPILLLCVLLFKQNDKQGFHRLSLLTKFIMATGLLTMVVFFLAS